MLKKLFLLILFSVIALLLVLKVERRGYFTHIQSIPSSFAGSQKLLVKNGGRVSWYKGDTHNLIAYDAIVDSKTKNTEVFTISPDGNNKKCVTCKSAIPKGFIGQPEWHPGGEYILIQAESKYSNHRLFNHLSWGVNNDLWLVKKDGSEAFKIWNTPKDYAALHAHFNKIGDRLIFSERVPTGKKIFGGDLLGTPGGENQWDGWRIHIADFNIDAEEKLKNHRYIFEHTGGFYETHEFLNKNSIVYSHTPYGKEYVDDVYISDLNGSHIQNLTNSPNTWEEHGSFSPIDPSIFVFMSSRLSPWNASNGNKPSDLRQTELYAKKIGKGVEVKQISFIGAELEKNTVLSDYDWNSNGTQIVAQVVPFESGKLLPEDPQLWIINLPVFTDL